jgi:hypothetical protein
MVLSDTTWAHHTCAIFIQSADFAGANRLQNQRTNGILPIFSHREAVGKNINF